ncbi:MAG: MBL fold metallo-hydrolase [Candidatus Ranarchaeia archaeon]
MVTVAFLGTAGGSASPTKNFPLIVLAHNDVTFMLEAGEGASSMLLRAGYDLECINVCLISHMHLDHCLGLPSLLLKKWLINPDSPTHVYIPKGGAKVLDGISLSLPARTQRSLNLKVSELENGETFSPLSDIEVKTLQVSHDPDDTPRHRCYAYRIKIGTKKIVYTGDTNSSESLARFAFEADLLISEATFLDEQAELAYQVGHLTAGQVGRIASHAKAKHLVLTHMEPEPDLYKIIRKQTESYYTGPVTLAYDGLILSL